MLGVRDGLASDVFQNHRPGCAREVLLGEKVAPQSETVRQRNDKVGRAGSHEAETWSDKT